MNRFLCVCALLSWALVGLSLASPHPGLVYGGVGAGGRAVGPLRPYDPPRVPSRYPNCGNNPETFDQTCCIEGRKKVEQELNSVRARGYRVDNEAYYNWDWQSARCMLVTSANNPLFAYNSAPACEHQVDIRHCCNYSRCGWSGGQCHAAHGLGGHNECL